MVTPPARALKITPSRLSVSLKASLVNLASAGFSIVSGLPAAPVGRVRYQGARSMTSAGMFAVPTVGAAAVVAPATDDAAVSAVGVVPAVPVVAVAPVRLLTLAAPDVSVLVPPVVFALVSTEPVAADVPVEPVTDDGQEAAPSVTPEVVETLPPEVPAELLSIELLSVELLSVELLDESSELPEFELPESELPESELSSESLEPEPLEPESLSQSSSESSSERRDRNARSSRSCCRPTNHRRSTRWTRFPTPIPRPGSSTATPGR